MSTILTVSDRKMFTQNLALSQLQFNHKCQCIAEKPNKMSTTNTSALFGNFTMLLPRALTLLYFAAVLIGWSRLLCCAFLLCCLSWLGDPPGFPPPSGSKPVWVAPVETPSGLQLWSKLDSLSWASDYNCSAARQALRFGCQNHWTRQQIILKIITNQWW